MPSKGKYIKFFSSNYIRSGIIICNNIKRVPIVLFYLNKSKSNTCYLFPNYCSKMSYYFTRNFCFKLFEIIIIYLRVPRTRCTCIRIVIWWRSPCLKQIFTIFSSSCWFRMRENFFLCQFISITLCNIV